MIGLMTVPYEEREKMLHGGEASSGATIQYDFSVNVNPLGIPENVTRRLGESLSRLMQYPDRECRGLRAALQSCTGVPAGQILCGNGASELIEASVRALGERSILLTAPSFSGYRHAAQACGTEIRYHELKREENFALTLRYLEDLAEGPDMAILCSPANPVGNRIDPDLLMRIVEICEQQGTWLLVDECFIGFTQDEEQTTMRRLITAPGGFKRLLVLDAFTKRFAVPGIRLGYLMASEPEVLARIHEKQPEWSVSVPAQIAGAAALETDPAYMKAARDLIAAERTRMTAEMEKMGFRVYPGEANYIFFSTDTELFEPLLERGILIRRCDNYRGLGKGDYRAAIRLPKENDILLQAMKEICRGKESADE